MNSLVVLLAVVCVAWSPVAHGAQVCCDAAGQSGDCYSDAPPFDGASWPLPNCFVPQFRLYRNDISGYKEITKGNTPNEYNRNDDTMFLIHGWQNDGDTEWLQDTRRAYLNTGDFNIVIVDWSEGSSDAYYPQSASNVRVNGAEVAEIWDQLNPSYSHCIGHSLGAHSCGHAGKSGANWNRITGQDPAGPNFDLDGCASRASECRLHPSDAPQVDCIHTNGVGVDSYGTLTPLGDIDFYPNGAELQPGCPDQAIDTGCSHGMASIYYAVSIENDCFVVREQCSNENNLPGSCSGCGAGGCPNMGAYTDFGSGLYYLETNENYPHCQNLFK